MPDGMGFRHPAVGRDVPRSMADRLIVALDVPTIDQAKQIVEKLTGTVSFFKVGLTLQFEQGADDLISMIVDGGHRLFLDAKMYDIGETVGRAIRSAVRRRATFVTVHGDEEIMRAAVKAKRGSDLQIFAVTVLTSLDDDALKKMGYALSARELVLLKAKKAVECECEGIIASANDDPDQIRELAGSSGLLIATPGIRPHGSSPDDQKRITTPRQAIASGADYLVIGRPIFESADVKKAALDIIADMELGRQS